MGSNGPGSTRDWHDHFRLLRHLQVPATDLPTQQLRVEPMVEHVVPLRFVQELLEEQVGTGSMMSPHVWVRPSHVTLWPSVAEQDVP
ncbi:hypothetical protein BO221_10165 [Archangium sp. Cb G35]|nr:hypothetical protein BO221_10165 [Archangium sp. Cb G35]